MKTAVLYKIVHDETGETHEGTAPELAAVIFVSKQTIYKMALQGKPIAGHWMVTKVDNKPKPVEEKIPLKRCLNCGTFFIPVNKWHDYCTTNCRSQHNIKKFQAELRENTKMKEGKAHKTKKPKQSMTEIAVAARQAGMSYGEYVAKMGV